MKKLYLLTLDFGEGDFYVVAKTPDKASDALKKALEKLWKNQISVLKNLPNNNNQLFIDSILKNKKFRVLNIKMITEEIGEPFFDDRGNYETKNQLVVA